MLNRGKSYLIYSYAEFAMAKNEKMLFATFDPGLLYPELRKRFPVSVMTIVEYGIVLEGNKKWKSQDVN